MSMSLYQIAKYAADYNDVPVGIVQAQLAHESAHGTSEVARLQHNYGGLTEWEDGSDEEYHTFASDEDFADYYAKYLSKYGVQGVRDPRTFVHLLKEGGYFGDDEETYAGSVESMYNTWGDAGDPDDGANPSDSDDSDSGATDDGISSTGLDANYIMANTDDQNVTNTERMRPESLHGANLIGKWAKELGLTATLTGGAEYGVHASGEYSHENGYKGDFVINGVEGGTKAGDMLINFAHEHGWSINWEDDHWDIDFSGHDSRDQQSGPLSKLKGNGANSLLGDTVANGMQGAMYNQWSRFFPQQDPAHQEYKQPSIWGLMASNFWDELSSTGTGQMLSYLYGNLFASDTPFTRYSHNNTYRITDDDVKLVKEALPGDKDAQNFILTYAHDRTNMMYLLRRKQAENKRQEELERWRESNAFTLKDWMVRLAGGVGTVLDPVNLIPLGEAAAGVKMATRLKGAITNVAKAKTIASYAAEMGAKQVLVNGFDDKLKETFSDQKPNYALNAAVAFAGGAISGAFGGVRQWRKLSAEAQKVVQTAEKVETDSMLKAADAYTDSELKKIRNETFEEAMKYHDAKWAAEARKRSKVFAALDDSHRVVAVSRDDAKNLVEKLTGKDLPDYVNAFHVPNEDYTLLIKDSKKATANLDKLLAHESMHGSIRDFLGEKRYQKVLKGIQKDFERGKEDIVSAARKAGTTDPEEILGQLIEDGSLSKTYSKSVVGSVQSAVNNNLHKLGFKKNLLSKDEVMDIIQADWKKRGKEPLKDLIYLNDDGSTIFAGIKFSKDNILNPENIAQATAYEAPLIEAARPNTLKRTLMKFGPLKTYFTEGATSLSKTMRKYTSMIYKDASGGSLVGKLRNSMTMEAHKQNIMNQLNNFVPEYWKARDSFIGKFKQLTSNEARYEFDEMVMRYYNAINAGNTAGFAMSEVPEEVKVAANVIKRLRESILELGKRSSSMVGSKNANLVDKAWYPVDDEIWRTIDPDKLNAFIKTFVTNHTATAEKQMHDFLSKYIDTFVKRDIIKERIVRDNKVLLSKSMNKKMTEDFLKKHPINVKDVSDEMAEAWLNKHKEGAINEWLHGGRDLTDAVKDNPNVGRLSPFQSRIPLDTSGVLQYEYAGKKVDFSFDNTLRKYKMDDAMGGSINRFAGEAAMQAVFADDKMYSRVMKKIKRELGEALSNHQINEGEADSILYNFEHGIYDIRGLRDPNDKHTVGVMDGFVHLMRGLAYMKNGANMGWNQLGELGGSLAYGGVGRLFDLFPPLGRYIERIRYGDEFAKNLIEDTKDIFGTDLMDNIFSRPFADSYMARNFARKGGAGGVYDAVARMAGMAINQGSRLTSLMNMLPKTMDVMVKGMQRGLVTDSIRAANGKWTKFMTLRNPFSLKKLAAAGITPADWDVIQNGIKKFTKLSDKGEILGLNWRAWRKENPVAFSQWCNWVQQGAERAIIDGSNVGNKSIMKNASPLTQLLFQFKDFSLRSFHGQTMRAAQARDVDDFIATGLGILTNTATWAARGAAMAGAYEAAGLHEKAQEMKDRLTDPTNIARAVATRSSIIGTPLSFANDWYESLFNTYSIRTTVDQSMNTDKQGGHTMVSSPTDIAGRMVTQLPAVKEALSPFWAIYTANQQGGMTDKTAKRLIQAMPIQNWIPFTVMEEKLLKEMNLPTKKKGKSNRKHGGY